MDVDAKDGTGRTVGEIARARKYQDVLNLLPDSSHTVVPSRMNASIVVRYPLRLQ